MIDQSTVKSSRCAGKDLSTASDEDLLRMLMEHFEELEKQSNRMYAIADAGAAFTGPKEAGSCAGSAHFLFEAISVIGEDWSSFYEARDTIAELQARLRHRTTIATAAPAGMTSETAPTVGGGSRSPSRAGMA